MTSGYRYGVYACSTVVFPGDPSGKEPAYQHRRCQRHEFDPWVRKVPWRRHGNPPQYPCLENPRDRGAWWATVHGITKTSTWLKLLSTHVCPVVFIIFQLFSLCVWCVLSHVQLFATPWTVACQAPLSMGFSRQEYWSGLPFTSPGDLPNPGIEPKSLASLALAATFFSTSTTWEALFCRV